ncbi:MAG: hypothetical protein HZB13_02975, partial [Acidobacteria bacterium]|nr:hypothetical protein [Acidobacteriota bacterium]
MRRRELLLGLLPQPGRQGGVAGSILVHEHVLVDFAGAESTAVYDRDGVLRLARPRIEEVKALGCRRLLE